MAQYFTDFSEYADTTAFLAEWTVRYNSGLAPAIVTDGAATGGKALTLSPATQARRGLSWNVIDADSGRGNIEALIRLKRNSGSPEAFLMARGSGAAGSEHCYRHGLRSTSASLAYYASGGFTEMGSISASPGTNYRWLRISMQGTAHKLKYIVGGLADEPPEWSVERTNSVISGVGWVGLFGFREGDWQVDVFSIGTNGDPAPTGPVVAGAPELTLPSASLITSSSIVPNVTLTF